MKASNPDVQLAVAEAAWVGRSGAHGTSWSGVRVWQKCRLMSAVYSPGQQQKGSTVDAGLRDRDVGR
ncbi:hypothetical protein L1887_46808 [Cichorium endivia]|nr:hypothetical protein L1887_46808 [Cichorium endivia]